MLRISTIGTPTQCRLVLEGKLVAPWAAELRTASEKARADLRGREFVIDMKNVTAISQEGENVLFELMNEGVKFLCYGVFTRHVFKQLSRRVQSGLQEATG